MGAGRTAPVRLPPARSRLYAAHRAPQTDSILIIAIDDESFSQTGLQWPWPRSYLAEIVRGVAAGQPAVIVLDVFFYEADPDPMGDAALAAAIAEAGNVILVNDILREERRDLGIVVETYRQPIDPLNQAARELGLANIEPDPDGVVRRTPFFLVRQADGRAYFSWPVLATADYLSVSPPESVGTQQVTLAGQPVPLRAGYLDINFRGPTTTFRRISAYQIPLNDYPPETFTGKIVLIGATSVTLRDTYPTPFGGPAQPMPGVEVQANAINTLLARDFIRYAPAWANLLLALLLGIVAVLLPRLRNLAVGIRLIVTLLGLTAIIWVVSFASFNLVLPASAPFVAMLAGFAVPAIERAVTEQLERRRLRERFELFVPPEVIEDILNDSSAQQGRRATLTVLFSDIRGFTTLSETLTPEEVVAILNTYLAEMTELIFKYGGTVDKYEGDAILAFWGAPVPHADDAARAVNCALEMRAALHALRAHWQREGFEIGIGINTGEAFVGTIGSRRRISYTCIGDAVNLASRLQDLTKEVGHPIVISDSTLAALGPGFETVFIDARQVKGRSHPVQLHAVLGRAGAMAAAHRHAPR